MTIFGEKWRPRILSPISYNHTFLLVLQLVHHFSSLRPRFICDLLFPYRQGYTVYLRGQFYSTHLPVYQAGYKPTSPPKGQPGPDTIHKRGVDKLSHTSAWAQVREGQAGILAF